MIYLIKTNPFNCNYSSDKSIYSNLVFLITFGDSADAEGLRARFPEGETDSTTASLSWSLLHTQLLEHAAEC